MRILSLFLVMLTVVQVEAGRSSVGRHLRHPASGSAACPEEGCHCEPLKELSSKCESLSRDEQVDAVVRVYTGLAVGLRQYAEERQVNSLKDCPYIRSAEQCRGKLKRTLARMRPRSRHYKSNMTDVLGKFSAEMMDSLPDHQPRSPASSRSSR